MRQILFRAKRVDNGDWCYGVPLVEGWSKKTYIASYEYSSLAFVQQIEVIHETVGQFTGLVDRNGKRIFEGDIIKDCDYDHIHTVRYFGDEDYPAFDCQPELQFCECNGLSHLCASSAMEVIGNIHDNHELLTAERIEDNEKI